jgi:signal transduction histidine kinase
LTSILKNAFEAIDESGSVTIKTLRTRLEDRDAIEIQVSDTGRGIPSADLPKIFDLFFTTKGEAGLGFGLWRDKIIIMRLGGEIAVQSEEKKGSTFTLRIPTKQNTQHAENHYEA